MPIAIQFIGGMIEIRMTGDIVGSQLYEHLGDVLVIEEREPVTPNRLVDLTEASTADIRFNDVHSLAQRRRTHRLRNAIKSAIVAATPVQFGIARTFQALNDNPQITIRIFRDEAEARAWLAE